MDCILPFAITIAWSSFAGEPVPSMTRTWLRTKTGASTLTKSATSLAFWVWATAVATTSNDTKKNMRRISMPRKFDAENLAESHNSTPSVSNGSRRTWRRMALTDGLTHDIYFATDASRHAWVRPIAVQ